MIMTAMTLKSSWWYNVLLVCSNQKLDITTFYRIFTTVVTTALTTSSYQFQNFQINFPVRYARLKPLPIWRSIPLVRMSHTVWLIKYDIIDWLWLNPFAYNEFLYAILTCLFVMILQNFNLEILSSSCKSSWLLLLIRCKFQWAPFVL